MGVSAVVVAAEIDQHVSHGTKEEDQRPPQTPADGGGPGTAGVEAAPTRGHGRKRPNRASKPRVPGIPGAPWDNAGARETGVKYVYLIGPRDGLYKIGYSINPARRLYQLPDQGNGLKLVAAIPSTDARALEKWMHAIYGVRRVHGEWFSLSRSDVSKWPSTEADAYQMDPLSDACLPFEVQLPEWLSKHYESQRGITIRLNHEEYAALTAYINSLDYPVKPADVARAALRHFLRERGNLPRPPKK